MSKVLIPILIICTQLPISAQTKITDKLGGGINLITKDSSFSTTISFRSQNLYEGVKDLGTRGYDDNFMIRRMRLKFDGFIYDPRIEYKIELGLAPLDASLAPGIDPSATGIIFDAVVKYNFYKNWTLWFGQAKMPGNIERVISSQDLQFVDRSFVNSRYTLDRDQGVQLHYDGKLTRFIAAISKGEGRNDINSNFGGYQYTYRFEYLPMGKFDDYVSSDLKRHERPKLMLGITYDYNDAAIRQRGNLGPYMPDNRTLQTWFVDGHFKYMGFSTMFTYANKTAGNQFAGPFTDREEMAIIRGQFNQILGAYYTGDGLNIQSGYLLRNNFEVAGRYTQVLVERETGRNNNYQYTLGVSKYVVGHTLKVQSDITLIEEDTQSDKLMFRFQVEFGI